MGVKKQIWRGMVYPKEWVRVFKQLSIPRGYITIASWCKLNNYANLRYINKVVKDALNCEDVDLAVERIRKNVLYFSMRGGLVGFIRRGCRKEYLFPTRRYDDCYSDFIFLRDFCLIHGLCYTSVRCYVDLLDKEWVIMNKTTNCRSVILVHKDKTPKTIEEIVLDFYPYAPI